MNHLNRPVMANVYMCERLALKAGVQVGYLLRAKMHYCYDNLNHPSGKIDIKDNCDKLTFGIPVGLSYEYNDIVFDARYTFGL